MELWGGGRLPTAFGQPGGAPLVTLGRQSEAEATPQGLGTADKLPESHPLLIGGDVSGKAHAWVGGA